MGERKWLTYERECECLPLISVHSAQNKISGIRLVECNTKLMIVILLLLLLLLLLLMMMMMVPSSFIRA